MNPGLELLPDTASWDEALRDACAGRGIRTVYQPIVDVERGVVVGYEALSRFDSPLEATPDRWFEEAHARGLGSQLEAVALATALAARADLPPGCFLSVNVGPHALGSEAVNRVLHREPDLAGVVLELTEHAQVDDYARLGALLDIHRARGALVAIDDAGAGYSGLQQIVQIRPSLLKLDRGLVCDIDRDDVKHALVQMMSTFARRIGAQLLAEGIERPGELDAIRSIGVPLAQGFFFALPEAPFGSLRSEVRAEYTTKATRLGGPTVRSAMEIIAWVEEHDLVRGAPPELAVVIGGNRRPLGFADPARPGELVEARSVSPDASLADAASLAMDRPESERLRPLLCVDAGGRYLGVARVERLVAGLARRAS